MRLVSVAQTPVTMVCLCSKTPHDDVERGVCGPKWGRARAPPTGPALMSPSLQISAVNQTRPLAPTPLMPIPHHRTQLPDVLT